MWLINKPPLDDSRTPGSKQQWRAFHLCGRAAPVCLEARREPGFNRCQLAGENQAAAEKSDNCSCENLHWL